MQAPCCCFWLHEALIIHSRLSGLAEGPFHMVPRHDNCQSLQDTTAPHPIWKHIAHIFPHLRWLAGVGTCSFTAASRNSSLFYLLGPGALSKQAHLSFTQMVAITSASFITIPFSQGPEPAGTWTSLFFFCFFMGRWYIFIPHWASPKSGCKDCSDVHVVGLSLRRISVMFVCLFVYF